ncbi:MAG: hypothetical protein ACE5JX_11000 [Acidobacteriota bacterium]
MRFAASTITKLLLFGLLLAATAAALKTLNWLGLTVGGEGVQRYASLEAVGQQFPGRPLHLPVYFPEDLQWPPWEILVRRRPCFILAVHVRRRPGGQIGLAIRESECASPAPLPLRLQVVGVRRRDTVRLKGREALLLEGDCAGGGDCIQVAWREDPYRITLVTRDAARGEALQIASSMLEE